MQNSYEVLELFPTPLFVVKIPPYFSNIVPWLHSQEMLSEEVDEANYGQRSKDSYILHKPEVRELSNFILEQVKKFGDEVLLYDYESYKFSQSWVSVKYPGQHHTMHTHPNSLISGVFYYGTSTESTPAIKFHKLFGGTNVSYIRPKTKSDKRSSKFAHETFSINFEPGLMILFPSHLTHSVPVNKTDNVRCSLAFNVVPTKGFGEEQSLTELLF